MKIILYNVWFRRSFYSTKWEAVAKTSSIKKVLLEISQNSQENTCVILFFNKVAGNRRKSHATLIGTYVT